MKTGYRVVCIVLVAAAALIGCNVPFQVDTDARDAPDAPDGGSITVTFGGLRAQSLLTPDIDMSVASLTISGSGPFNESFSDTIAVGDSSYTRGSLVAGDWTLTVNALNSSSEVVAGGSVTLAVQAGATAQGTIDVRPLSGDGTVDVSISWPDLTVENATVNGTVVAGDGTETPISFNVSGNTATYNGTLAAGYYDLFIDLSGTNNRSWTHYVAVRVIEGQTTSGSLALQLNQETGNLELVVTADLLNPVDISMAGLPAQMYYGDSAVIDLVLTPQDTGNYSYSWILNGSPISGESSASLTLSANQLSVGTNVIAVRVGTSSTTSAKTLAIEYVDALPAPTVSVPADTTEARPTWTWGGVSGAQGYRYGYTDGTWITETATVTSFTPDSDLTEGSYTLFVQAQDDRGTWSASGQADTNVVGNTAPAVAADPGDQSWEQDADAPVLDLAAIFEDQDTTDANLTFNVSGGSNITYTLSGSEATFAYNASFTGSETITLSATDDDPVNPKTTDLALTFTVQAINGPPTIDALSDLELLVDAGAQTISLTGLDDGDSDKSQSLTVTASSSNTTLIPTPTVTYSSGDTGSLAFTPAAGETGSSTITVTVTDSGGTLADASSSVSFVVDVVAMQFTEVQGPIFSDTTWSLANSPYLIAGPASVSVETGATLTIEAGVEVYVNPGLSLLVKGTLSAIGTDTSRIRFIPANQLEPWVGIKFAEGSIDASYDAQTDAYLSGSTLQYVDVDGGGNGAAQSTGAVELSSAFPFFASLAIRNSAASGIAINTDDAGGIARAEGVTIENSAYDGLYFNSAGPTYASINYSGMDISGSGESGIQVNRAEDVTFRNSVVRGGNSGALKWLDNELSVATTVLDNVTVEDSPGNSFALFSRISDSTFSSNAGYLEFQKVEDFGGAAVVENTVFQSNTGGIEFYEDNSFPQDGISFSSVDFANNDGTIYISTFPNQVSSIEDSAFDSNVVQRLNNFVGGGIHIRGVGTIRRTLFRDNTIKAGTQTDFVITLERVEKTFTNNTLVGNDIEDGQPASSRAIVGLDTFVDDNTDYSNNHFVFEKRANLFMFENLSSNTQPNWDLSNNYWVETDPTTISTYVYGSLYDSSRSDVNINPPLTSAPTDAPAPTQP